MADLQINDTDASIGLPRLHVRQPMPVAPARLPDLQAQLTNVWGELLGEIQRLQNRVFALEQRTWTSMLRDQIAAWWKGLWS